MKRRKKVIHTPRPAPKAPAGHTPPKPTLPPDRYVLRIRLQHCRCCCTTHCYSELFTETKILGPNGGEVRHLQRVAQPEFSLPYTIRTMPLEEIAFCHECSDDEIAAQLAALPKPPKPDYQRPLFYLTETQAAERNVARQNRTTTTRAVRVRGATLDDLNQL